MTPTESLSITLSVNGATVAREVPARLSLADFLREELRLTGTHLGCEHGVCGACTVLLDGEPVRACLMLAVQARGHSVTTVEGLTPAGGGLTPLQAAFQRHHAVQCGFCTPGMLMTATALLAGNPSPSAEQVRDALSGNICRCTGYVQIVEAVMDAAAGAEA
ncbi:(2Fe-2S)-binding protein [Sabulicella rubraurantiaca]|uniref:(2Fe-2S)-binding protein n=1 Tax=Sabulicella rubraurantiaca TaxID=2811429 RepID=UPI001A956C49|nr:(2Fe-2S)-binding protein [Sabulicella rubraurantiaca]